MKCSKHAPAAAIACAAVLFSTSAPADVAHYAVDPNRSMLTMTTTVLLGGSPLDTMPQAAGSDTTRYSGTLVIDRTATAVTFLAGSTLTAANSGDWLPGTDFTNYPGDLGDPNGYVSTAAAANYGGITDLTPLGPGVIGVQGPSPSATRGLVITLADAGPHPLDCGTFDESGIAVDFAAGTIYYSSGGSPPVTDMANTIHPQPTIDRPADATLVRAGATETVTLPFSSLTSFFINFLVVELRFEGTIVAVRSLTPGDLDGDDAVDAADLDALLACFDGPGGGPPSCACRPADLDGDDDVDLLDAARLQAYAGG